jgi:uncharacterized membrane protein
MGSKNRGISRDVSKKHQPLYACSSKCISVIFCVITPPRLYQFVNLNAIKPAPTLKIKPSVTDRLIEILGWLMLIIIWVIVIINYAKMPDSIPTHYNAAGNADEYGDKSSIFLLPIIASVVFVVMTVISQFPHIFNKAASINTPPSFTDATRMLRYLKLAIALAFFWIILRTTQTTSGKTTALGSWFLPVALALILVPVAFFIVRILRAK